MQSKISARMFSRVFRFRSAAIRDVPREALSWTTQQAARLPGPAESGLLVGLLTVVMSQAVLVVLGTSLPVTTGLLLVAAVSLKLGWTGSASPDSAAWRAWTPVLLLAFTTAWAVALPWLTEAAVTRLLQVSPEVLARSGAAALLAYVAGSLLLGPPALAAAICLAGTARRAPSTGTAGIRAMTGFSAGLLLSAFVAGPLWGAQVVAVTLGVYLASRCGLHAFLNRHGSGSAQVAAGPSSLPDSTTQRPDVPLPTATDTAASWSSRLTTIWCYPATLWLGAMAALLSRWVFLLVPVTLSLRLAFWSALAGGCAAGWAIARRTRRFGPLPALAACLLTGTWAAGLLAAFPAIVSLQLWCNAHLSQAWLMHGLRLAEVFLAVLPAGIACGLTWASASAFSPQEDSTVGNLPPVRPLLLLAGMAGVTWFSAPAVSAAPLLAWMTCPAAVFGVAAMFFWLRSARQTSHAETATGESTRRAAGAAVSGDRPVTGFLRKWRPANATLATAALAGGTILVLLAPWWRTRTAPAHAAGMLFSTNVFLASRGDLPYDMLPHLDESRLVDQAEGDHATLTLWSRRGVQLQLRDGGVPGAVVSRRPSVCPQFAAEIMPVLLPLTVHESPGRVLLLGAGGGGAVSTGLAFPVRQLICVEGDRGRRQLLERNVWPELESDPRDDDRLQLVPLDPILAVRSMVEPFDVIVSCPLQTSLFPALAETSPAFYRAVSRRLNDDGIFCQRLQHVDFGPRVVASLVHSMMQVFGDVAAVATAPGEWTVLAARMPGSLDRGALDQRMSKAHVRRQLAKLGWDWSVPLNLQAFNHAGLAAFVEQQQQTAGLVPSDRLPFALPVEVMRWAPKQQLLAQAVTPHAGRLLNWQGVDTDNPDLLRRLAEVAGQRELIVRYPDQKWSYRKSLKQQMTGERKGAIRQVAFSSSQDQLHPQDQRRVKYLRALGAAVEKSGLTGADIDRIVELSQPYDPLVSYFVHEEAAVLARRLGPESAAIELQHRLHLEFYSDARDRSVRNSARALEILCRHPETMPDVHARRDMLDALLQVVKQRWETRGLGIPQSTRIVLNDLARSISAVELTFATLDKLTAEEPQLNAAAWAHRRAFLDRALLRPLRTYRSRLLPHHLKHERTVRQLLQPGQNEEAGSTTGESANTDAG